MKARHAAALALVGWYLMLMPLKRDNGQVTADLNASISQWSVIQAFDTAIACNEAQIKWKNGRNGRHKKRLPMK